MQAPLSLISLNGTFKSYLIWLDSVLNRWLKEEIPSNVIFDGLPPKPAGFRDGDNEWAQVWYSGQAFAASGRAQYNSPTGDTFFGACEAFSSPVVGAGILVHTGDSDNSQPIVLRAGDYLGTLPNITMTASSQILGMSILNGVLTLGK